MEEKVSKLGKFCAIGTIIERHTVIFTHNGVEKVRLVSIPYNKEATEDLVRELLLAEFGIVADEIIQIG